MQTIRAEHTAWQSFFDTIYLINLDYRVDRNTHATNELYKYDIDFTRKKAVQHENGAKGLWLTMLEIFDDAVKKGKKRILVFEDDVLFLRDPNLLMPAVIEQLQRIENWHLLNLGPNTHEPLQRHSDNLLKMRHCRATHAVSYSAAVMYILKNKMKAYFDGEHIDTFFEREIQPLGKSYCTYPMICTQRNDFSDVTHAIADQSYIETRFIDNTKHLV